MSNDIGSAIDQADSIVVIQADNPDGDSLASALALEYILGEMGKNITLYCGVNIPEYLRYLEGWDRVHNDLPNKFDLAIIVDTNAISLFDSLLKSGQINTLRNNSVAIIDHHATDPTIDFATVIHIEKAVATGEIIYNMSKTYNWPVSIKAAEYITTAILSDSLGITSEATTSKSIKILSELVDKGVSLANLDNKRKVYQKKSRKITKYKGSLLQRITYSPSNNIALVSIPWKEIEQYSHEYNPAMLVIDDMRMVDTVKIAIVLKSYPDGKITGKIRANYGFGVADKLAENFGGGGHTYAAGFKIKDKRTVHDIELECIRVAENLLEGINNENI